MAGVRTLALFILVALLAGCAARSPRYDSAAQPSAPEYHRPAPSGEPSYPAPSPERPAPPPADMRFQDYGTNPQINTLREPVSTFAIDVDTASYTLVRNYLVQGMLPPPEAVRVEEFINYFPQSYPAPDGNLLTVYLEGAPSPFRPHMHVLQVGLRARDISRSERRPAMLTFVIDVSGSMAMQERLELVKESLQLLLDQLGPDDRVAIVTYNERARVVLEHTPDSRAVRRAIDQLAAGGSTNAAAGLMLGYELAAGAYRPEADNRVILCSDGVANVGATGPEKILRQVAEYSTQGIALTTVGVGMGNYNDVLLEQLADRADGNYAYVDDREEARRVFVDGLTGTLAVVAKDVKVQVQFDPEQVASYRLLGYENRALDNRDFRNDRADAGEMGAGHTVTALYELELTRQAADDLGLVAVRYRDPETGDLTEIQVPIQQRVVARRAEDASAQLRWTAAVAEYAGVLRGSPWSVETDLQGVLSVARPAADELAAPAPHREFLDMVLQTMRLSAGQPEIRTSRFRSGW